ncbi:Protein DETOXIFICATION 12 [Ananas comosus]|uniref:Protein DETOXIFICATION 12 n=1 Tax=Ananas comosus TaxID=4615 RepID=A0A199UKK2_ANACO|nr:Protein DETOXIFICATION 12 [Ananas comosus]
MEWSAFEVLVLLSGLLPNPQLETSVLSISLNSSSMVFMVPFGLGAAVSNEEEVVNYMAIMLPILAISIVLDAIQAVLSGVARGCGWQKIGAFVNLGTYYIVGIPTAVVLAFALHFGGKGRKAKNRVFSSTIATDMRI